MKRNYPALRLKSRNSSAGDYADEGVVSILGLSPEQREAEFEKRWQEGGFNFQYAFTDVMQSNEANQLAAAFVHRKIHEKVHNQEVADLLCPKDHPFGAKRLCVDTGYYETFNRDNVTLVDIRSDPIKCFTSDGLRTEKSSYAFDTLVLATGFDAITGALLKIDIVGRNGQSLRRAWADGAAAYLGLAVTGFPNMFIVTGPGSPSVLANVVLACEQHVEWISEYLRYALVHGVCEIEAEAAAQENWTRHVADSAALTLYPRARSWYLGANVLGKPRVFLAYVNGFNTYCRACEQVSRGGYEGFRLRKGEVA